MEMAADHTTELLSGWLRAALRHLYDPQELRRSPLMRAFGLERQSSPSALRQLLIDAIEALKPAASASPQSDAWRIYRTLSHRYVEQFSQEEVAGTFGLSIRQLRRLERLALRAPWPSISCLTRPSLLSSSRMNPHLPNRPTRKSRRMTAPRVLPAHSILPLPKRLPLPHMARSWNGSAAPPRVSPPAWTSFWPQRSRRWAP